jgi:hypothetical protein
VVHPTHYPDPMPDPPVAVMNCPRCDRTYDSGIDAEATLEMVKRHVEEQHPDHDPDWAEDWDVVVIPDPPDDEEPE